MDFCMSTRNHALASATTADIQKELESREGVTSYQLGVNENYKIDINGKLYKAGRGPCTVTINID